MHYLAVYILLFTGHLVKTEHAAHTNTLLEMCGVSSHVAYGPAESGFIVSPKFPSSVPQTNGSPLSCTLRITACSRCKIRLNFDGLQRSWLSRCRSSFQDGSDDCRPGCNHLLVYEPGYYEATFEYITAEFMPMHYESHIRELTLKYCQSAEDGVPRNFSFTYDIIEKDVRTFGGHTQEVDGIAPVVGQFASFGFPRGYSSSGDTFVYYIHNENANGHVRLTFEDWNLSPYSDIMIYEGKTWNMSSDPLTHATGANPRPFVVSASNSMTVVFRTGTNIEQKNYIGFKASYYFVSSADWIDKPTDVDEVYFSSAYGGELSVHSKKCTFLGKMDHLWVIPRSRLADDRYSLLLQLKTTDFSQGDTLEIRRGNNSEGELVPWLRRSALTDASAFYIRLRMTCAPGYHFAATFTWMRSSEVDGCRPDGEFHCERRQYCIPLSLRCDHVDHCGDASDESSCSNLPEPPVRTTTVSRCWKHFHCRSGELICMHQRCDDTVDCRDMSDEHACHDGNSGHNSVDSYVTLGVVVPVLVVLMIALLTVCAVMAYCVRARIRRSALTRVRLRHQHVASLHAAGHFDEHIPSGWDACLLDGGLQNAEDPPSYGASIQCRSVSGDRVVRPPSYHSTGEPAVKYSVVKQQDVDNSVPPPAYISDGK